MHRQRTASGSAEPLGKLSVRPVSVTTQISLNRSMAFADASAPCMIWQRCHSWGLVVPLVCARALRGLFGRRGRRPCSPPHRALVAVRGPLEQRLVRPARSGRAIQ
eukprot:7113569-Lingulodinium_polyedra.AAC.1